VVALIALGERRIVRVVNRLHARNEPPWTIDAHQGHASGVHRFEPPLGRHHGRTIASHAPGPLTEQSPVTAEEVVSHATLLHPQGVAEVLVISVS